jgi:hypothetical protein
VANMIAMVANFRARARARARTRTRTRTGITGTAQLHSEGGRVLNKHNTTTGRFRLRARLRFG